MLNCQHLVLILQIWLKKHLIFLEIRQRLLNFKWYIVEISDSIYDTKCIHKQLFLRQDLVNRINIIDNKFWSSSKNWFRIKHSLLVVICLNFYIYIFLFLFLLFIDKVLLLLFLLWIVLLNILLILYLILAVVWNILHHVDLRHLIILLFHDFIGNFFVLFLCLNKLKHFFSTVLNILEYLFDLLKLSDHYHKLITYQVRSLLRLKYIHIHFLSDLLVN